MRILFLTHQYLPDHVGGTELYTHSLAKRAQAHGHTVRVLTYIESRRSSLTKLGRRAIMHDGLEVTQIHYNLGIDRDPARAEYDNRFTYLEAEKELDAFRPQLVHCVHAMKLSASVLDACTERGIPYIISLTDFWFICPRHTLYKWDGTLCDGPAHRLACVKCVHALHGFVDMPVLDMDEGTLTGMLEAGMAAGERKPRRVWADAWAIAERSQHLRQRIDQAEQVLALSEFQKRMFVQNGYDPQKIRLLRHGLETAHLEPSGPDRSLPLKLLFIGSIVPYKGLHILLEALQGSRRQDIQLRIYGKPSGRNAYARHIGELVRKDARVRLMGEYAPSAEGEIFRQASILLVPALWYENEPLVVKAALYCHVPVMASAIGSLTEMVDEGTTGWLLPPGDVAAWQAAIDALRPDTLPSGGGRYPVVPMDEHAAQIFDLYERTVR